MAETKELREALVEDKSVKEGTNGKYYEFKLDGRTFRWFPKNEEEAKIPEGVKLGDNVNATYTETTKGQYTYKNLVSMTVVEVVNEGKTAQGKGQPYKPRGNFQSESRRIVRQNAMTQANSLIATALEKEIVTKEDLDKAGGLLEYFKNVAEYCEKWVFRD